MIYEINFLTLQSKTEQLEKIRQEIKKFIESYGASIVEEKEYLKRKLAYEVKHENYGFFTVLRFKFEKSFSLDEMKNKLNQKEEIARYIIIKADELPSLKEQDIKKIEKTYTNKKSIKSEDVEKALKEQAKKETEKKEETTATKVEKKPETTKLEKNKEAIKEEKEEKSKTEKDDSKKTTKKKEDQKNQDNDEEVSLDELDKKLDEILNS
jgi:small subunit ribosomal protein S6